jgi:hypothetical protein
MPKEGYLVLVDPAEAHDAWKKDQTRWKKYVAAHYTKMLVKGGLAYAVNHFTFSIGGVIFEGPGIVKTDLHIKRLLEIRDSPEVEKQYACGCDPDESPTCRQILNYTIEQKLAKYGRRIVAATPVVGTGEVLRAKIHAVTKTGKGVKREQYARLLHGRAEECLMAQAIVAELLGSYRSQDSWKETFSLAEWNDGWKVLKEKMAST